MDDTAFMRAAIAKARDGIRAGQTPFGAAVVHGGRVLVAAHNTVWRDTDPTAHAEVGALRQAARLLRRIDLAGCDLFTTCEPCPMCLVATHWAKVDRVVFGATIEDAAAAVEGAQLLGDLIHVAVFRGPHTIQAWRFRLLVAVDHDVQAVKGPQ